VTIVDARLPGKPTVYVSPSFERLTGWTPEEMVGTNCSVLEGAETDPAVLAVVHDALETGTECSVELLNYRKDGSTFWNALTLSPVTDDAGQLTHFVCVLEDITEKRELGEHIRESQRLEALGQLAGGVAHDFNNLLTVIMGNAFLAVQTADLEVRRGLDDILAAGDRATVLVRQLLAFSRQQPVEPGAVDLNDVVSDARRMLDRLIEATIEVRYELSDEPVTVLVDRGQIEQVLVNLAVNARDAMPDGGRLVVRTKVATGPGGRVGTLTVEDTGTGIADELRERIFTPFFTTKEVGKGTGLGLAAAYGIVDAAGGDIDVDSVVGSGSVFTVRLPLARAAAEADEPARLAAVGAGALAGARALLVEDDSSVRAIAEELLIRAGCELVLVADPDRAIELTEDGEPYDVLITDLVMPKTTGIELAKTIRELRPELPVLFVSGYPRNRFDEAIALPNSAYVPKPFNLATLQSAFGQLVSERAA
jgi:PAS domain S-box-containing protein